MSEPDTKHPGQRLRHVRQLARMTQKEFGEACRIGEVKAVARRESGQYQITLQNLAGIDKAFSWVNVMWIINNQGSPIKGVNENERR